MLNHCIKTASESSVLWTVWTFWWKPFHYGRPT